MVSKICVNYKIKRILGEKTFKVSTQVSDHSHKLIIDNSKENKYSRKYFNTLSRTQFQIIVTLVESSSGQIILQKLICFPIISVSHILLVYVNIVHLLFIIYF
jgi:hypothetical protein